MSNFKTIKGFSKYEISESGTMIRNIKNKALVGMDKGGNSVRLYNDEGERVTINKKDFDTKLIPINGEPVVEVELEENETSDDSQGEDLSETTNTTPETEEESEEQLQTNEVETKTEVNMATKAKATKKAPAKKAAAKKEKKAGGIIAEIIALFEKGKDKEKVLAMDKYNPSTVRVQWGKFNKKKK